MKSRSLALAALLSAFVAPAMADQSGGTMDSGSTGMGSGSSRLNRDAAPNRRMGAGTTSKYHGTSGSNKPRSAGQTPSTSTSTTPGKGNGGNNHPG